MNKLKVDTLEHELKITKEGLKVGCQTISKEDAMKIADFIKEWRVSQLPEDFEIIVPNKRIGAVLVEDLRKLGIFVHGREDRRKAEESFEFFSDDTMFYQIIGDHLGGNLKPKSRISYTLDEFYNLIK